MTSQLAVNHAPFVRTNEPRLLRSQQDTLSDAEVDLGGTVRSPSSPRTDAGLAPDGWPTPGSILGKYRLGEVIGRGTASLVYRAEHLKLPLELAIKVLHLDFLPDARDLLAQLKSEAAVLAQLNHPHLVRLWDFEDEGAFPYLVLELVRGRSLSELIGRHGRLPAAWVLRVLYRVVEALESAHRIGIVHRDLKPDNILLTNEGSVKLADLGLAVVREGGLAQGVSSVQSQAALVGTAAYLAPEQALKPDGVDHRADMYGLGATFYHALTGRRVFEGRSIMAVVLQHIREQPTPPNRLLPSLDRSISDLLLRLLAKQPQHRFNTYEELKDAILKVNQRLTGARPLVR